MMRILRIAGATALLLLLGLGISWSVSPSTSKAAFNAGTFHTNTTFLTNLTVAPIPPVTVFTIPPSLDLTITDITYSLKPENGSMVIAVPPVGGAAVWADTVTLRVYDGGPNVNPTLFGTGVTVMDECVFHLTDWVSRPHPTDPIQLEGFQRAVAALSQSRHFQTGLVIPSGNDLKVDFGNWMGSHAITGNYAVSVQISGILQ